MQLPSLGMYLITENFSRLFKIDWINYLFLKMVFGLYKHLLYEIILRCECFR